MSQLCKNAGLSVVVVFFNMPREARRTLHTLSRGYQELDKTSPYEVIAIDHGSTSPLSADAVHSLGPEFTYRYVETGSPSPCFAINQSIADARFDNVMIVIDGARMLSPGIARLTLTALKAFAHPFIYTIGMHLGTKPQNYLVSTGYNQVVEDELLQTVDWRKNGYSLFSVSSPALSSKNGFFSKLSESNCFTLRKEDFTTAGSYRSEFRTAGGGLCNLELFNRLNDCTWLQPVVLLGEASFHQFHGGVATNVPISEHPWKVMEREYTEIVGERYRNKFRPPFYLGPFREECSHLYFANLVDSN